MKLYTSNKGVFPDDWKIVKLGSLCDLQNGYAFKSTDYVDSSNTLSCRMSNIRPDGEFDLDYHPKFLPDPYADKYQQFLLKDNDVIIAMTDMATEPKILGVPTVVSTKGRNVLLNQRVGKLVIKDKDSIFFPYLKRVLGTNRAKQHYLRFAGGGVQINLSKEDLLSLEIPLPPLEEQQRIAAILDKADGVRRKRKEAIRLTEELLRSTFLEMFGDPVTNPKGWETHKLKEFTKRPITYGILKPGPHVSEGIPMLRIQDIHNGRVTASGIHKVSPELSSEYSRTVLRGGEIVISLVGTLGLTALIPESLKGANVHRNLGVIDIESEIVLSSFIFHYFKFSGIENFLLKNTKGGVQSLLNLGELREMPVNLPPLSLQQDFESLASNQIALNTNALSAYEQSENLFNSLLQRAFRGEL